MRTIQILAVMILMVVSQVLSANTEPTRATAMYQEGTILKVWAVNGLNMRDGPGKDFPISRKLQYGDEVKITDPFIGDFPMSIKVIDKKGKKNDFELKGNWVRVMLDDVEGYVFDGYLSRLPVIRLNGISKDNKGHTVYEPEYIETYLKRKFDLENEASVGIDELDDEGFTQQSFYGEDKMYFMGGNKACGWDGVELKNMTLNEGYLLFNLMYSIESKVHTEKMLYHISFDKEKGTIIISVGDGQTYQMKFKDNIVTISSEGCC